MTDRILIVWRQELAEEIKSSQEILFDKCILKLQQNRLKNKKQCDLADINYFHECEIDKTINNEKAKIENYSFIPPAALYLYFV
ncbi:MAG: hypothetical protein JST63_09405 [Bacteroidetes bacterium]|nr:hypothetical protein [Bacteroidota bacterium]